ncbi:MAG TPA: hypothetical protein PKE66_08505, partial [Pyrinomonadaceae bacterium]|nr:hypothetical protein [Pyrinomonadaceae bacterium]
TKVIKIAAPRNHIFEEQNNEATHDLYVGTRKMRDGSNFRGPFLGIDKSTATMTGGDCPFVWTAIGRKDDVATLTRKQTEFISSDFWGQSVKRYIRNDFPRVTSLLECINVDTENKRVGLNAWILKEGDSFSITYSRSYWIPGTKELVKVVQVCRKDSARIFVRHQAQQFLLGRIRNLFQDITKGIESTQASNPIGLVPVPKVTIPSESDTAWVGEWESPYGSSGCSSREYSLKSSVLLGNSGKDIKFEQTPVILPLVKTTKSGKSLQLKSAAIKSRLEVESLNDNGTALRFLLDSFEIEDGLTLIDGAFEFDLDVSAPERKNGKGYGEIRFTLQNKATQRPFFFWQYHDQIPIDDIVLQYALEDFSLPVKKVRAAGQDLIGNERYLTPGSIGAVIEGQGERNDSPLVIPITKEDTKSEENKKGYFLTFSESVNVGQDYRLDVKLQEFEPSAGNDNSSKVKAVIVDTHPQFIGLVEARFLQQPGYDDGAWILARRSHLSLENGAWEILDDSANTEGFKLILPSQAIGEAYVKNDQGSDGSVEPGEPEENEPIEYRFGSPAIIRLANERLERRYVAPPWNLRHIWGQPGSESPGVPFLEAQFELLYGLTGHLKPARTFIAELASKLGEVPVPPDSSIIWEPTAAQNTAFSEFWRKNLQFYRAWKSRLAILELSQDDAFANAKFIKDLKFSPRILTSIIPRKGELKSIVSKLHLLDNNDGSLTEIIDLAVRIADSHDEASPNVQGIYDLKSRLAKNR